MNKVTAIIPVFNAQETLIRAVDSLLIQPEIDQIILVEDGSSDESFEVCKDLVDRHQIIELFHHPNFENKGAPAARNLGLQHAKNDWIQFMDADDELLPFKIKEQLGQVSEDMVLVVSPFSLKTGKAEKIIYPMKDIWSGLIATRLGRTTSNLFNKKVVLEVGGWNENLKNVQEYYLMFEILKENHGVRFTSEPLTLIYPQLNSISHSAKNGKEKKANYFIFRQNVNDFLKLKNAYTLRRKHFFTICTGKNLEYFSPPFPVRYNKTYYQLYDFFKSIFSKKGINKIRFKSS